MDPTLAVRKLVRNAGYRIPATRSSPICPVSVYAIDPTPLEEVRSVGVDAGIATTSASDFASGLSGGARLGTDEMGWAIDTLHDGLRQTAQETGGKAIIGTGEERTFLAPIEMLRRPYAADGVSIGSD